MKPRRIRFKSTQHILLPNQGLMKSEYDNLRDGIDDLPPTYNWNGLRPLRVEDVDIWQVITETSNGIGVYCAWCPYDELYIITNQGNILYEFYGFGANEAAEQVLINMGIRYPKTNNLTYKNIPAEKSIII